MKTRTILIFTLLFVAIIYSAFSLLPTKTVANSDPACGEYMRQVGEIESRIVTALPVVAMPQTKTPISLKLDSSLNGYTIKSSDEDTEVGLVGARDGTSESSPLLNGKYRLMVTLENLKKITRTVMFRNGIGNFGRIKKSAGRVKAVSFAGCPCGQPGGGR